MDTKYKLYKIYAVYVFASHSATIQQAHSVVSDNSLSTFAFSLLCATTVLIRSSTP